MIAESLDDINAATDVEYVVVEGFTKGTSLRFGSLSAADLIEFSEENETAEGKKISLLRLISRSLVNTKGERYASNPESIKILGSKAHKTIERLAREAMDLNGIVLKNKKGAEAEEKAKNA